MTNSPKDSATAGGGRTQVERRDSMRQRLIDAAISCVHENGYGATTTRMVAGRANVTRGALAHHFPAKADLMVAALRAAMSENRNRYEAAMNRFAVRRDQLLASPSILYEIGCTPAGIATLEILIGSRSDPELDRQLVSVREEMETAALDQLERNLGRPPSPSLAYLVTTVSLGLEVTKRVAPDADHTAMVLSLFKQLLELGIDAKLLE